MSLALGKKTLKRFVFLVAAGNIISKNTEEPLWALALVVALEPPTRTIRVFDSTDRIETYEGQLLGFLVKLGFGDQLEALGPCASGFQDETVYGEQCFGLTCLIDAVVAMSGKDPATSPNARGNHDT